MPVSERTRLSIGGSVEDPLGFAAVYEDPAFELAAFGDVEGGVYAGPSSGGDTTLGLLSAGAGRVVSTDVNRSQNHHVELLHAALTGLSRDNGLALLDVEIVSPHERERLLREVLAVLSPAAARWWLDHIPAVRSGLLRAGKTERGMGIVGTVIKRLMTDKAAVAALLSATTLAEQREVFDSRIRTRRWRSTLALTLNPVTCRPLYRDFFDNIDVAAFSTSMREGIDAAFRDVPIWENHYLHMAFEGRYRKSALPIFMGDPEPSWGELELVDGDLTTVLKRQEADSLDGVWLSNIGEWLPAPAFEELLSEAARVTRPGGRVVWSNFVPRPVPLPAAVADRLAVVPSPTVTDRSLIRYQRIVCDVV